MRLPRPSRGLPFAVCSAAALLSFSPSAQAATADATVTGGGLTFINGTPGNVSFPAITLNGANQVTSRTQPIELNDARGSGAGWNITATSTQFTSGSDVLPKPATTLAAAPTVACNASIVCTTATTSGITYPYTLPADTVAPPATRMFNATADTGMAAQTVTPDWQLLVPGSASVGNYTSTWTFSLVSGP